MREQAVALRRDGRSLRQIRQILGPIGNRTLHDALRGEPPPTWTRRPNAKAAERFWRTVTEARPEQFGKTTLKHHNPLTLRKNTGDGYHGCLRVDVRRSRELYRKIEGWACAVTAVAETPDQPAMLLPGEESNLG